eukprot:456965_1
MVVFIVKYVFNLFQAVQWILIEILDFLIIHNMQRYDTNRGICYDNTVVGYKQCVYGTETFNPIIQTDIPTITSLASSKNPTSLSLSPTKKQSVYPIILTLCPSDYPTPITPIHTQITDVPTNDHIQLDIPLVGSTKQYGIFVGVMVVMIMDVKI